MKALLLIFFVAGASAYSQGGSGRNELIVFIHKGLVDETRWLNSMSMDTQATGSKQLRNAVTRFGLRSFRKAFPMFQESDTLKTDQTGRQVRLPNLGRLFRLSVDGNLDSAIASLGKISGIVFAEKVVSRSVASDPKQQFQWYLRNPGYVVHPITGEVISVKVGADAKIEDVWPIFTGSSSIRVGVFDTGVDLNQEDLNGKVSGDNDNGYSHGTRCAGIIGAKADNGKGIKGIDWQNQLVSRRLFDADMKYVGQDVAASKILDAVNGGVHILNHSYGGTDYSVVEHIAFAYACKLNRVNIVSMGNGGLSGSPTQYPAAFPVVVLAVGATTDKDNRAPYSSVGSHIGLAAPGGYSTELATVPYHHDPHGIMSTHRSNNYYFEDGTSFAAPIVSGVASLLKGFYSGLNNDDIVMLLKMSADDLGASGWDIEFGHGRINATESV